MKELVITESIEKKILVIRGRKVLLDRDLAELYGVPTKVLNQAVKRNLERFPEDFMFQLSKEEFENWKSQFVTSNPNVKMGARKHPFAFTEQGISMLSSVLNSERAIAVNIAIMRVFVRLRQILYTHKEFTEKLNEHSRMIEKHDKNIKDIFGAIHRLENPPHKPKSRIGFKLNKF
ncbi:MAG: ORF6N domain-containing protein [Elusimicrobiota bacterium]